jgi:hypothetical protein
MTTLKLKNTYKLLVKEYIKLVKKEVEKKQKINGMKPLILIASIKYLKKKNLFIKEFQKNLILLYQKKILKIQRTYYIQKNKNIF